jgi:putative addiction module killer protein
VEPIRRPVDEYELANGKSPYGTWVHTVDGGYRGRIRARIRKIEENGNYGDCQPVGEGVCDLRFHFGPGYRVYFGIDKDRDRVVLLTGGDKDTQTSDIERAKKFWRDYNA